MGQRGVREPARTRLPPAKGERHFTANKKEELLKEDEDSREKLHRRDQELLESSSAEGESLSIDEVDRAPVKKHRPLKFRYSSQERLLVHLHPIYLYL
jgi:hypothetical protein